MERLRNASVAARLTGAFALMGLLLLSVAALSLVSSRQQASTSAAPASVSTRVGDTLQAAERMAAMSAELTAQVNHFTLS